MKNVNPDELLARDAAVEAEVQRRTRLLRGEVDRLTAERREIMKLATFYDTARKAPIRPTRWTRAAGKRRAHEGVVVAQMTDWHLDEVVQPEEILGLNAFNRAIAHKRIARWIDRVVTLPRDYM